MREPIAQCFVLAGEWLRARSHVRSRLATSRVALWTVLLAFLVAGCTFSLPWEVHIPATLRTPTIAGVVVSQARLANGHWRVDLADGQTLEIDADRADVMLGGPQVGRLLLAGTGPDGRQWVAGIAPAGAVDRPPGCYPLSTEGRDGGDVIATASGFLLHKAAGFHSFSYDRDGVYSSATGVFCLDDHGLVTSYDIR